MKHNILFLMTFCCALSIQAQSQIKSGLILQGGTGKIQSVIEPTVLEKISFYDISYNRNFSIGYRFHIKQSGTPIFFNVDANLGMKSWQARFEYLNPNDDASNPYDDILSNETSSKYYLASLAGTVHYSIYKGLSTGVGLEPTYLIWQEGEDSQNNFDLPIVAKLAYDFGPFELGINYKYGLMDLIKTDDVQSGKFREWQFSLFIPF